MTDVIRDLMDPAKRPRMEIGEKATITPLLPADEVLVRQAERSETRRAETPEYDIRDTLAAFVKEGTAAYLDGWMGGGKTHTVIVLADVFTQLREAGVMNVEVWTNIIALRRLRADQIKTRPDGSEILFENAVIPGTHYFSTIKDLLQDIARCIMPYRAMERDGPEPVIVIIFDEFEQVFNNLGYSDSEVKGFFSQFMSLLRKFNIFALFLSPQGNRAGKLIRDYCKWHWIKSAKWTAIYNEQHGTDYDPRQLTFIEPKRPERNNDKDVDISGMVAFVVGRGPHTRSLHQLKEGEVSFDTKSAATLGIEIPDIPLEYYDHLEERLRAIGHSSVTLKRKEKPGWQLFFDCFGRINSHSAPWGILTFFEVASMAEQGKSCEKSNMDLAVRMTEIAPDYVYAGGRQVKQVGPRRYQIAVSKKLIAELCGVSDGALRNRTTKQQNDE